MSGMKTILRDSQGPRDAASSSHSFSREGESAARDPLCRVYTTSSLSGSPSLSAAEHPTPTRCCAARDARGDALAARSEERPPAAPHPHGSFPAASRRKWRCCQAFLATAAVLADHVRRVGTRVPRNLKLWTPVHAASVGLHRSSPDSDLLFCSSRLCFSRFITGFTLHARGILKIGEHSVELQQTGNDTQQYRGLFPSSPCR